MKESKGSLLQNSAPIANPTRMLGAIIVNIWVTMNRKFPKLVKKRGANLLRTGNHTHEVELDQDHEVMKFMTRFNFLSHKEKEMPDTILLVEIGSTCSMIKDRNLLKDVAKEK